MSYTIGVDIGGTKVSAGVVDEAGKVLAQLKRGTPARSADATRSAVIDLIGELSELYDVEAVGLAAAGFVDETRSRVLFAPNIPGWRDEPLRTLVERTVNLPVVVENDANAAAWGEARHGAGQGEEHLVCVTVGTGIGGGMVLGGALYRGRFGVASEFGHIQVVPGGRACGCGNRGCWEQYASGSALVREARARAADDRKGANELLALGDGTPEGVTGPHVTLAAQEGDPVALAALDEIGRWLGQGLADLAAVLDPGCFVIGGGVSEAGELLLGAARRTYVLALTGTGHRPHAQVRQARLGNEAGIVGAADLARRR